MHSRRDGFVENLTESITVEQSQTIPHLRGGFLDEFWQLEGHNVGFKLKLSSFVAFFK